MDWGWATSLDELWRSPTFPMWLTLAAAGFFGIIVLVTLLRAEKSVANGALTVITLLAVGIAVAATIRGFGPEAGGVSAEKQPFLTDQAGLPALACIDDLAGEIVLTACEKVLFGSAETAAAAVSYAASRITRLTAFGNVQSANSAMTPELQALRSAVERDRYGLMAYVLLARDHCTPSECAAFRSLTDHNRIVANMDERTYEGLISRYAPSWGTQAAAGVVGALPASMPTGKPTNADFPSAASTPPVSIMTAEPAPRAPAASANATSPPPHPATHKPAAKPHAQAPVRLAPTAPAPAASNE